MPRTVAVAEFLVACESAWRDAPESLRAEALAMVTGVALDFLSLPDTQVFIPASPAARPAVLGRGLPEQCVESFRETSLPEWLIDRTTRTPGDDVFELLIAPESGGVLTSLLQILESCPRKSVTELNLAAGPASVFADKLATAGWLKRHGLPTPETLGVSSQLALELLRTTEHDSRAPNALLKPVDGCGSTLIRLLHLTPDDWQTAAGAEPGHPAFVLQPLISGEPWSIGLIGQAGAPPFLLPPARQNICCDGDRLWYAGGSIEPSTSAGDVIRKVAAQFAALLPPFLGYVGLDVVLQTTGSGEHHATIIEVNPRLCTSYIGYRAACRDNLAAVLLGLPHDEPLRWRDASVHFRADGTILRG